MNPTTHIYIETMSVVFVIIFVYLFGLSYEDYNKKKKIKKINDEPLPKSEINEVINAWRVWRLVSNGKNAILRSCVTGAMWEAGVPMAATEKLLARQKYNGVYAYKKEIEPKDYGYTIADGSEGEILVHGRIALWGKVIEHEEGYRAEFAYPTHIIVPAVKNAKNIAQAIRAEYGCEATVLGEQVTHT